jgi:SAM-dependent methyltransferase
MINELFNFYQTAGYSHKTHYRYFKLFKDYLPESGKILDLGCADGKLLLILRKLGFEAVGLDIAQSFVDRAQLYSGCNVFCGTAENMVMFKEGEFDCIICTEVLEHVTSPYRALLEMNRILKLNGTAIISSPNAHHIVRIMRPLHFVKGELINKHINCFDLTQWKILFSMSGFEIVLYKGWPGHWIFPRLKGIGIILDKLFRNQERFKKRVFYYVKKQKKIGDK